MVYSVAAFKGWQPYIVVNNAFSWLHRSNAIGIKKRPPYKGSRYVL